MTIWVKNIARKFFLLATMLLISYCYAHAQNTAAGPYLNSWHQYSVIPMGDDGNDYEWIIYNNEADAINGAIPNGTDSYELTNALSWVKGSEVSGGNAYIEILFDETIFSDGDNWYLIYAEYSDEVCVARRRFNLAISLNSFYVELPGDDSQCNTMSGEVFSNSINIIRNADLITRVPFTVTMHKALDFTINTWEFTGSLLVTTGSARNSIYSTPFVATNGVTNVEGYAWAITGNASSFTITVTINDEDQFDTDNLTFEVQVEGDVTTDYALELDIDPDEIKATSGSAYIVETGDNGTGLKIQTRTRLGVPNTSVIAVVP